MLTRRNAVGILLGIELMLNAVNINLVAFSRFHGNVAGMGEALHGVRETLPTFRAHNEQGMAHAAIAFAKASRRRRMMACTTSIGPGATNMVTAAAVAKLRRREVRMR